jgi:hypothetical protein
VVAFVSAKWPDIMGIGQGLVEQGPAVYECIKTRGALCDPDPEGLADLTYSLNDLFGGTAPESVVAPGPVPGMF